jgi:ankyrin repeat protein
VDINSLDHNKQSPLCYAVGNNHVECVRILLDLGANPNLVQNWGNTPMHVAASTICSREILQMLLDAGGDVDLKNEHGESVLDVLKSYKRQNG